MFLPQNSFFQTKHLGIALTGTSLRLLELDDDQKIVTYSEAALSQPLLSAGQVNVEVVRDALIQAAKNVKLTTNFAAVCIPEKLAFSREYTFPQIKLDEVDEAIRWQLEKIFPFAANEIYTDWKFLSQDKNGIKVFIVAVPKNILDQLKTAFESGGILPISFEPSASAITRLIPSEANKKLIVVELDATGSTSTLVLNGISSITATTSFSSESNPQEVFTELVKTLKNLCLQLTQRDLTTKDLVINLVGEKSSEGIAKMLQDELKLPVTTIKIEGIKPEQQLAYVAAKTQIQSPLSTKTINLLPTILQEHYQAKSDYHLSQLGLKIAIGLILPSLLITVLGLVLTQIKLNQLQQDVATAKQTQTAPAPSANASAKMTVPQINQLVQRINKLFSHKTTPEQPLTAVLNHIPEQIVITNIVYERPKKQFTIVGSAPTRDDLFKLQEQLESDESIKKVTLPLSSLEATQDIQFSLAFIFEPPAAPVKP